MTRVLVIEDEPDLAEVLLYNLVAAGFEAEVAARGADGLVAARRARPDVVLLDLMLPDLAGTEVCRALKADPVTRDVPVIMLTARGEEIDRVVGFELGADDYVVKPFSVRELLLRVRAVDRRARAPREEATVSVFGALRVDRAAHRAWVDEQEIELTALEFKLLTLLMDRRGRVQTRARLRDAVWGITSDGTTPGVDTRVKRLREKLGRAGDYVETVRGVGYRFAETPG
ncbi:MAG: response regulator transcription factor [Polyangiaceae bacterium]|nr:response regulator transcription factor [Polyangiaceae bacterium]